MGVCSGSCASLLFDVVVLNIHYAGCYIIHHKTRGISAWKSSNLALLFHDMNSWNSLELYVEKPEYLTTLTTLMTTQVEDEDVVVFPGPGLEALQPWYSRSHIR